MLAHRNQARGDTLIEVLFAVAVFSLVAVGTLSIMNEGSAAAERALEITLAREQMNAQAETLRFLNASYVAAFHSGQTTYSASTPAGQWALMSAQIQKTGATSASDFGSSTTCPTPPSGSFVVDPQTAQFVPLSQNALTPATTYSQLVYTPSFSAQGLWIEAISAPTGSGDQAGIGYIDFHIRTCWPSPGQPVPVTLGTIVRLYEPR